MSKGWRRELFRALYHQWRVLVLLLLAALPVPAFPGAAYAEVHVTGAPNAVAIEAHEASVEELLSALSETYDLHYSVLAGASLPISGSYAGPLPQVLARVLQRYDFTMETSATGLHVAVYGASGAHEQFNTPTTVPGSRNPSSLAPVLPRRGHGEGFPATR